MISLNNVTDRKLDFPEEKKTQIHSDEQLIEAIVRRDGAALEELYDRHAAPVFSLAKRILRDQHAAEEVTQEVFILLWRKASTFRAQKSSVRSWLMRVTRNRSIDEIRKRDRRSEIPTEDVSREIDRSQPDPDEILDDALNRERVLDALNQLSTKERRVLVLSYFDGLSHRQIAEKTGLPLGTVKTDIRRAMKQLREKLVPISERESDSRLGS